MALYALSLGSSFRRERPDPVPGLARRPRGERGDALQEHRGWPVVRPDHEAGGEGRPRLLPRPGAVGGQARGEAVAQITGRRADLARPAEDLEDALRLAPAGD